jgi:hypothetical protein
MNSTGTEWVLDVKELQHSPPQTETDEIVSGDQEWYWRQRGYFKHFSYAPNRRGWWNDFVNFDVGFDNVTGRAVDGQIRFKNRLYIITLKEKGLW